MKICARPECGRSFKSNRSTKTFCSARCRNRLNQRSARAAADATPEGRARRLRTDREREYKGASGITLEQKAQRISAQGFQCANPGCRTQHPGKKGFATDHSHATGKLRGELCNRCNVALGMA